MGEEDVSPDDVQVTPRRAVLMSLVNRILVWTLPRAGLFLDPDPQILPASELAAL